MISRFRKIILIQIFYVYQVDGLKPQNTGKIILKDLWEI